ncbi:MAG: hypothetical protein KGL11_14330 [Alphaproteobacteria bacterium]|nr:hypothetical protein [Alphaproteobacteria bacterium]
MALFSGQRIAITKIEAARRQLRTALELWFADGDPVSIHTLAYAAYEVVHFVAKSKDPNTELIFDWPGIKDEARGQWRKIIAGDANFFKHANRDPDDSIEFGPAHSKIFIMFSLMGLRSMKLPLTQIEEAFSSWLLFNHPEVLTAEGRKPYAKLFEDQAAIKEVRDLSRSEFLERFIQSRQMNAAPPRGVVIGHIQLPKF